MAPVTRSRSTAKIINLHDDPPPRATLQHAARIKIANNITPYIVPKAPRARSPPTSSSFGLVQEKLTHNLYALVVQAILWNQTTGKTARPVLDALLSVYPDPAALAQADLAHLTALLYPIGLYNVRAARLIKLANAWLAAPPTKERRYRRVDYPQRGDGRDVGAGEVLGQDDAREGWEIAHLPGVGPYCLDSYRIFYRDTLREIDTALDQPEWRRVVPADKELRAYLVWKWRQAGFHYDVHTGNRTLLVQSDPTVVQTTSQILLAADTASHGNP
ncbi:hypothetical protein EMMF5_002870 [Cystobasidiomycetes sp. EMM_F5]